MAKKIIHAPKGTHDILPKDQPFWEKVKRAASETARDFNFLRIETPIFEDRELFARGIGLGTDIVEKEMFAFTTRGRDKVALRPEMTAGIVRAFIEHGLFSLAQPLKLWTFGPVFRYERPQAGRFRQHHQADFEIFGTEDAIADAQMIQAAFWFFKKLGLKNISLFVNSIGCSDCRPQFRKVLLDHYRKNSRKICADCKVRLKKNPLRILDCKNEKCQEVIKQAPVILDYLCDPCKDHFKKLLDLLDELEISYFLDNHLVRGLDYYNRTVFEFSVPAGDDQKIAALGGGGRYDGLVKMLKGKDTPAVGMGLGAERIIEEMKRGKVRVPEMTKPTLFLIQLGELAKKKSLKLFEEFLKNRISVSESFSRSSITSQLKLADRLGVKIALIFGQQEALDETIIIREMESGVQEVVPLKRVIQEVKKKLKKLK